MSERWKLGWLESYNAYTGEPERFVYRPGDDEHTRICVRGENCDEDARRIVASVNACLGIPTETLEAGRMVPLDLVDSILEEVLTNQEKYVPAAMLGTQGFNAYQGIMREIKNTLSRLQQNWEQPAETRITVTIDVQTYRGYRDRRVIEVEPGIGWADRLWLEVQRVAQEMEEFHLNGPSKQNGGADHD